MATDEEMRIAYQRQKEYDERKNKRREDETDAEYKARTKGHVPLSSTFEQFMGKKGHQAAKKPKPAPAPSPAPTPPSAPPKQSLGKQLLGAGRNWLENAAANTQGRAPPHKAKSAAGQWLANANRNINQGGINMNFNPFGGLGFPSGPQQLPPVWGGFSQGPPLRREPPQHREPVKRGKKKKKRRSEPAETMPWDASYLPPGARRFF
ncbi:MAG: hypothetical protein MUP03_09590 [Anaerolineales bacterium]|nr:hypothetical protein [Anaerolineales bacterium]